MIAGAHQKLKPGEHGEIFITTHKSASRQARVRVRLFDGSATEISRSRETAQEARLAVQAEIDVLLNAAKGSEDLNPDDKWARLLSSGSTSCGCGRAGRTRRFGRRRSTSMNALSATT